MTDLHIEGNHPEGVRAICKECQSVVLKDTEHEAHKVAESHNEQRHNGEEVAGVCAWDVQPLITDETPIAMKVQIMEMVDGLSHEDQRKVLGLVE